MSLRPQYDGDNRPSVKVALGAAKLSYLTPRDVANAALWCVPLRHATQDELDAAFEAKRAKSSESRKHASAMRRRMAKSLGQTHCSSSDDESGPGSAALRPEATVMAPKFLQLANKRAISNVVVVHLSGISYDALMGSTRGKLVGTERLPFDTVVSDRVLRPLRAGSCGSTDIPAFAPLWVNNGVDDLASEFMYRTAPEKDFVPRQVNANTNKSSNGTTTNASSAQPSKPKASNSSALSSSAFLEAGRRAQQQLAEAAAAASAALEGPPVSPIAPPSTSLASAAVAVGPPDTPIDPPVREDLMQVLHQWLQGEIGRDEALLANGAQVGGEAPLSGPLTVFLKGTLAGFSPLGEGGAETENEREESVVDRIAALPTEVFWDAVLCSLFSTSFRDKHFPLRPLSINFFYDAVPVLLSRSSAVAADWRALYRTYLRQLQYVTEPPTVAPTASGEDDNTTTDNFCTVVASGWRRLRMPAGSAYAASVCGRRSAQALERFDQQLGQWVAARFPPALLGSMYLPYTFAFDCEMVQGEGQVMLLARCTLIHVPSGIVLVDVLVRPDEAIVNYVTQFSGITEEMLFPKRSRGQDENEGAPADLGGEEWNGDHAGEDPDNNELGRSGGMPIWRLRDVQELFQRLLDQCHARKLQAPHPSIGGDVVIIGHSMENDFKSCRLAVGLGADGVAAVTDAVVNSHDDIVTTELRLVDTSALYPNNRGLPYKNALRWLCFNKLGKRIQTGSGGHDSAEDALVCAELVLLKYLAVVMDDQQETQEVGKGGEDTTIVDIPAEKATNSQQVPACDPELRVYEYLKRGESPFRWMVDGCGYNLLALSDTGSPTTNTNSVSPHRTGALFLLYPQICSGGDDFSVVKAIRQFQHSIAGKVHLQQMIPLRSARTRQATVPVARTVLVDLPETLQWAGTRNESLVSSRAPAGWPAEGNTVEWLPVRPPRTAVEQERAAEEASMVPEPSLGPSTHSHSHRGDGDAVRLAVRCLKEQREHEDAFYAAADYWLHQAKSADAGALTAPPEPPRPLFLWVGLHEGAAIQFHCDANETEEAGIIRRRAALDCVDRTVNDRVMAVVDACPPHTVVIVLAADCRPAAGNALSTAHGAAFMFVKAEGESKPTGTQDSSNKHQCEQQ